MNPGDLMECTHTPHGSWPVLLQDPSLLHLQSSWQLREVPEVWKKTNITFIFKKGNKEDPGKYRPISLKSMLGKVVVEQIILETISKHTTDRVGSHHCGFMQGNSCSTILISLYNKMNGLVGVGKAEDIIYLDISNALDTVSIRSHSQLVKYCLDRWIMRCTEN